ncbi:nuclease domain-containing protein [Pararobbsia silviterrae]|uniref:DUF1364 family protein n=1 Tax=Pararobbsia silviterrae TaxID=1792498 RepID=A0A494X225_9BURK|nr:nuclease domain-containing protein [Pararobbsia silviterrae]RKP44767.1 DUF1364 family protein [Pararobbsia silviterrae]
MQRAAPIARTKPEALSYPVCDIAPDRKLAPRSGLKSRRAPTSKIRKSANGEYCRLRLPGVCKTEIGNVVWAHSNRSEHGKAGGMKADDVYGCYACYWCHCVYDRQHARPQGMTLEFVETRFTEAMRESQHALLQKSLIDEPPPTTKPLRQS